MNNLKKEELVTILKYAYFMSRIVRPISSEEIGIPTAGYDEISDFYRNLVLKIERDEKFDLSDISQDEFLSDIYKTMKSEIGNRDIEYDGFYIATDKTCNQIEKDVDRGIEY